MLPHDFHPVLQRWWENRFAEAQDVVLFDPLVQADGKVGPTSTLLDMRVLARGSFAIVLLNTSAGVYAIRIESDGKFAPVAPNG